MKLVSFPNCMHSNYCSKDSLCSHNVCNIAHCNDIVITLKASSIEKNRLKSLNY